MKKIISILLVLSLALSLNATVLAADKSDKNNKADSSKNEKDITQSNPNFDASTLPADKASEKNMADVSKNEKKAAQSNPDSGVNTLPAEESSQKNKADTSKSEKAVSSGNPDSGAASFPTDKSDKSDTSDAPENVDDLPPEHSDSGFITSDAEETALADAGFVRTGVKGLHAYKLYTNGQAYAYRVQFGVYDRENNETTVYSYEISISDGAVLSSHSYSPIR